MCVFMWKASPGDQRVDYLHILLKHILVSGMLLTSWKSRKGELTTHYELLCHAQAPHEFYLIHKVGVFQCEKHY